MKPVLSIILPVVLGLSLFGCNKKSEVNQIAKVETETTAEVVAEPETQSDTQIPISNLPDDAPTIIISADANYPPYGLKDDNGQVTGFDAELIRAIGEREGFKVEILGDPWEETFDKLDSGNRNLIIGGTVYSDERNAKYILSEPYAPLPNTIAYIDNNITIKDVEDLQGLKLGVLDSSAPYRHFSADNPGLIAIEQYPTIYLAVQSMAQGKVDAIAGDSGVIRYTLNNLDLGDVKYYDYGKLDDNGARKVMIAQKSNPELIKKINLGLQTVKADGTYTKLTQKWFGKDLTADLDKQNHMLDTVQ
ncbi:substrate-binding periplasmic protein [Psychrobacter sp. I-STPA10]|uniref:substrate-binding periplasmic protein n=1 Tax=Psychrobacter sp. I-STPA10 TaxID=2585769 RepID=UPI001E6018BA|nr:transporter substrate-binding domain-containing protein [Psychrobacter sp. I-STPA10]